MTARRSLLLLEDALPEEPRASAADGREAKSRSPRRLPTLTPRYVSPCLLVKWPILIARLQMEDYQQKKN